MTHFFAPALWLLICFHCILFVQAAEALQWLAQGRCVPDALVDPGGAQQQQDADLLWAVQAAFSSCSHTVLASLVAPLVLPCLSALLAATQGGRVDTGAVGKCRAPKLACLCTAITQCACSLLLFAWRHQ